MLNSLASQRVQKNTAYYLLHHTAAFINPRRACAARVTVVVLCVCLSVCLSVCLFVSYYSRTTGYEAAYEQYQQPTYHFKIYVYTVPGAYEPPKAARSVQLHIIAQNGILHLQ